MWLGICDRCEEKLIQREDDRPKVIQQRFTSYERETIPVVESFRKEFAHLIWEESSIAPLDEILARIRQRLEQTCGFCGFFPSFRK
jgi:adenylate kinase